MESLRHPEQVASRLALQVVVTVVQFHHPRARELARDVRTCIGALGELAERPEWRRLLNAFEVLAREQGHHMRQEEELVLDRVQFLSARDRLVFGALRDTKEVFFGLIREHDKQSVLRRRLEHELANTSELQAGHPEAASLRATMRQFMIAFTEHLDFEQHALVPVLEPFLEG